MNKTMNPEIKARWVAALRSGEFQQVTGELRSEQGFCCLGVLCELHRVAHDMGEDSWRIGEDGLATLYMCAPGTPSEPVLEWCELHDHNPVVVIGGEKLPLAKHNDSGRTFAEIADAIEEQL